VEIIIGLTDTPKSIYDNVTLKKIQFCRGAIAKSPLHAEDAPHLPAITIALGPTHEMILSLRLDNAGNF
jgi:hypothetical protein